MESLAAAGRAGTRANWLMGQYEYVFLGNRRGGGGGLVEEFLT